MRSKRPNTLRFSVNPPPFRKLLCLVIANTATANQVIRPATATKNCAPAPFNFVNSCRGTEIHPAAEQIAKFAGKLPA
jgi:hypothetical protein